MVMEVMDNHGYPHGYGGVQAWTREQILVWAVMSLAALVEEFSGKTLPAARTPCSGDQPFKIP